MEREHYLTIKREVEAIASEKNLTKDEKTAMFCTYLAFRKVQYEKTGATSSDYIIQTDDEDYEAFLPILNLLTMFELEDPFMGDGYVWIYPKDKCRERISLQGKRRFRKGDYSWWNVILELGQLTLETAEDHPERYCLAPMGIFSKWYKYLPAFIGPVVWRLYGMASYGCELKPFDSLSDVIEIITDELDCLREAERKHIQSCTDREVLIKELYDFNDIPYPIDAKQIFDFLVAVKLIQIDSSRNKPTYSMAEECPNPNKALRFPRGWHDRAKVYVTTGSILFSYLSTNEVIEDRS